MKFYLPMFRFVFADTADTIAADTEAAAFIPEIWAQTALGRLHSKCPMLGCVSRNYEDELAKQGDTVQVPVRGGLVTHDKAANTTVTLQNPTGTTIPCVLTNHKEVSFLVEDVAEAQSSTGIMEGYMDDGADAIVEDIEEMIGAHYVDAQHDIAWDDSDADAIFGVIKNVRTKIVVDNKCPVDEQRYLVIRDMAELLEVDQFVSRDYIENADVIETGTVGTLLGFNVKESGGIVHTVSPTATRRMAFARGAIALVTRRLPNPPGNTGVQAATVTRDNIGLRVLYGYNMNHLGMQCTVDMLFGSCVLRAEWLADIHE